MHIEIASRNSAAHGDGYRFLEYGTHLIMGLLPALFVVG